MEGARIPARSALAIQLEFDSGSRLRLEVEVEKTQVGIFPPISTRRRSLEIGRRLIFDLSQNDFALSRNNLDSENTLVSPWDIIFFVTPGPSSIP